GRVRRGDALERASREVGREDDVHHVLPDEGTLRCDRVDDGDRPLEREVVADPHLLRELPAQGVDEALAAVDAAARQQPVLAASRLLVPAEEHPSFPTEDGGDADTRLERHQWAELPKPRSPRSLAGSSVTSTGSGVATG